MKLLNYTTVEKVKQTDKSYRHRPGLPKYFLGNELYQALELCVNPTNAELMEGQVCMCAPVDCAWKKRCVRDAGDAAALIAVVDVMLKVEV